jgi:hypothetical protein
MQDIKKQTPIPRCKDNQLKMMRKNNRPKIQPKKGFLSLCRHLTIMIETQEDSTTIKTYPTNTKLSNQEKTIDVHDYLSKKHVCTRLIE